MESFPYFNSTGPVIQNMELGAVEMWETPD